MKLKLVTLFVLTLIFSTPTVIAQKKKSENSFSISGVVKDEETGETLPFAQIKLLGSNRGTSCNVDGYFSLMNIEGTEDSIKISYVGYNGQVVKINNNQSNKLIVFYITTSTQHLNEIVVTDQAEVIKVTTGVSKISLNPQQLASLPNLGEVDIFRSIQLLPGISGTSETSSGLIIRGGSPDQNLILFDGFTVYQVDHFFGVYSAFNAEILKDVQVYKSAFPSKFGGRISGIVDITSIDGNSNKISGKIGVNLLSVNGVLEAPIGNKLTLVIGARRSYTDVVQSGTYKKLFNNLNASNPEDDPFGGLDDGTKIEPKFYFYDLNSKLTFRPNDKNVISFSIYNGKDNLDKSYDITFDDLMDSAATGGGGQKITDITKWGNIGSSVRWGRQWNNKLYSNLNIGASNYFSDYTNSTESYFTFNNKTETFKFSTVQNNKVDDITIRWHNEWQPNQNNTISFGVAVTKNYIDYSIVLDDTLKIQDRKQEGTYSAAYLQNEFKLGTKAALTLGGRVNHYDITSKIYVSPRASFTYQLTKKLKFKASSGIYYQFINRVIYEDITTGSRDFWLLANGKDIPIVEALHYGAGFTWEQDGFLVDVEVYQKDMTGLLEYSRRFTGLDVNEPIDENGTGGSTSGTTENFFEGDGVAQGLEVLLQKKTGIYTGWIGYTLSKVVHTFPEINQGKEFYALHDQRNELKLINMVKLGKWDLSATLIYATGKPYSAPIGKYQIVMLDGAKKDYISVGEKNQFRLPSYQRVDIAATYNFNLGKSRCKAGLSIFNLLGRKNVKSRTFTLEYFNEQTFEIYNPPRFKTVDVQMLGFTPNIFFNIKF